MANAYIAVDTKSGKAYLVFIDIRTKQELWDIIRRRSGVHELSVNPVKRKNKIAVEAVPKTHQRGLYAVIFDYFGDIARGAEVTLRNPAAGYRELQKTFP